MRREIHREKEIDGEGWKDGERRGREGERDIEKERQRYYRTVEVGMRGRHSSTLRRKQCVRAGRCVSRCRLRTARFPRPTCTSGSPSRCRRCRPSWLHGITILWKHTNVVIPFVFIIFNYLQNYGVRLSEWIVALININISLIIKVILSFR